MMAWKGRPRLSAGCRAAAGWKQLCRWGSSDSRVDSLSRTFVDEFQSLREAYATPKYPIFLLHGLFGFDTLHIGAHPFPVVHYWRGIKEALEANHAKVFSAKVPPSGSIEARASALLEFIKANLQGEKVNLIAHSMGGIDARHLLSKGLKDESFQVMSLTTIASPHRGSSFADYCIREIGPSGLPKLYSLLHRLGLDTEAFEQLTTYAMAEFNKVTPDANGVQYFSYGATVKPPLWSFFRGSHAIVQEKEGDNDGLVSVNSSKWGEYRGTLTDVHHLDLINWTNKIRFKWGEITGQPRKFNAVAFYMSVVDMLAKKGL